MAEERKISFGTVLTAQTAVVATGDTHLTPVTVRDAPNGIIFELNVSAAAVLVGDTLDVTIQTTIDGANLLDAAHFTQVLGNGGAKRYYAKLSASAAQSIFENATALTAGNVRNIIGDFWVVSWVVAGSSPSFNFTVTALPM